MTIDAYVAVVILFCNEATRIGTECSYLVAICFSFDKYGRVIYDISYAMKDLFTHLNSHTNLNALAVIGNFVPIK